ncbi:MAG: OmpA family protein [Candidatus Cloacimonetes bacterium]|nr:OmpA family protein [Candidatus Cloacimonadota bacterium]
MLKNFGNASLNTINQRKIILLLTVIVCCVSLFGQNDYRDSKDHPLLPRFRGYYIGKSDQMEDYTYNFFNGDKDVEATGKYLEIKYYLKDGQKEPLEDDIVRYFSQIVQKNSGRILYRSNEEMTALISLKDKDIWVSLIIWSVRQHSLFIVEVETGLPVFDFSVDDILKIIKLKGRYVIRELNFPEDSHQILNESADILNKIGRLLQKYSKMKFYVVGHTSDRGELNYNIKLSERRAEAVKNYLVTKFDIEEERLTPKGIGPLSPETSHKESGSRTINDRIELVLKQ